ncbi:hypothetical protein BFW88_03105 [Pseudomonas fluorescens]|uniref:Type III secretion system stator protein SctL n=1 Tax=Pseudomonas lactucae TaxID=2813360 RepID=A0A9X0Y948_9PSED|nr:type III secretion system stator protein SctL [Pseudomonas lactucae]OPA97710.1 hypothetical protein BFW88_03105 [Pseudomonas fluorescens]MBN2974771.1 type III secretion system stator protein SctL [Pseudomonas lactucae]MBN2988009.1 type III secretion system stator protein SctL [Pseudomonas lactucae]OPB13711.1 hypothetical protein BFW92_03095 [Pseudomonas fluorescens]OPB27341.1 hypothetical protein BFW93_03105 [Pseudomonas fluorescens]
MLRRRKIELYEGASDSTQVLVKRELLDQSTRANELVEHAKAHADQLVSEAVQHRDALAEQAHIAFWQRANLVLGQWEQQRNSMCEQLERYAAAIASQAYRCLLDDVPPTARLTALVRQLAANQLPVVQATLLCHPAERNDLEHCLIALDITLWALRPDERIKQQTLVLETAEGDFHIDWYLLRDMLLIREAPQSSP